MSPRLLIHRRPGTQHSPLEDVLFTFISAFILLAFLAVIFAPQRMQIDVAVAASSNPKQIEFYGILLDEAGDPVKGAVIELFDSTGAQVAQGVTKNDGSFSIQFNGASDDYTLSIRYPRGDDFVEGSVVVSAEPGYTYGATATLTDPTVIFVAIPGY